MSKGDFEKYSQLIANPVESLTTEIKRWLDPGDDKHKAKIVKALIALYNSNGGRLVLGLCDDGQPDLPKSAEELQKIYHVDIVQKIASEYIFPAIEIEVALVPFKAGHLVVIEVPSGVRSPAVATRQLSGIQTNDLFVRTTTSNHLFSSSKPTRHDWDRLIRHCLDNRESDIGAFFRRHLGVSIDLDQLKSSFTLPKSVETRVLELLADGNKRSMESELIRRNNKIGYVEVAIEIDGKTTRKHAATESFLLELQGVRPDYSGWPPFVYIPNSPTEKPWVRDGGWEASVELDRSIMGAWAIDFWRIEPSGRFYTKRSLQDDTSQESSGVEPGKLFDPVLHLRRIAEVLAIGLMFCERMGYDPDETQIAFAFRWTKLRNRQLCTWAHPNRMLASAPVCVDEEAVETVLVPAATPLSGLATYVQKLGAGLMAHFGGYDRISHAVVESIVSETLQRKF